MKINLLICDSAPESLQYIDGDYPDMFVKFFTTHNPKIKVVPYNVRAGQFPSVQDDCAGFVCGGSSFSVYDSAPWITDLKAYVHELYKQRQKFVGICFGHQIIAEVLGGKVRPSPKGWGVGVQTAHVTAPKDWMQPQMQQVSMLVSYQDQIDQLPPHSELLAHNSHCPYFMITVDDHFLGIQGHPEASKPFTEAILSARRERLGDECVTQAINSLSQPIQPEIIVSWIEKFLS